MTWGEDREEAIARMRRAVRECIIVGPPTTLEFHERIVDDPRFIEGKVHTGLVGEWLAEQGENTLGAPPVPVGGSRNGKATI
jgi:acetyl-CoA carboxylase biotin carboxylase subunit